MKYSSAPSSRPSPLVGTYWSRLSGIIECIADRALNRIISIRTIRPAALFDQNIIMPDVGLKINPLHSMGSRCLTCAVYRQTVAIGQHPESGWKPVETSVAFSTKVLLNGSRCLIVEHCKPRDYWTGISATQSKDEAGGKNSTLLPAFSSTALHIVF